MSVQPVDTSQEKEGIPDPSGQAQQIVWAPPPQLQAPPNCPPGLEYLLQVDQLVIKQQIEFFEAFTGFETANKYKVKHKIKKTFISFMHS